MFGHAVPKQQIYYIDSDRRISGSNSNFTHSVALPPHNEFDSVCVLGAKIPKSYYSMPVGKSYFTVAETANDGVAREYTVTLDPGNYQRRGLATQLTTRLNAASTASGYGLTFAVSIPNVGTTADTGKFTISCSNPGNLDVAGASWPGITFTMTEWLSPAQQLGFDISSANAFTLTYSAPFVPSAAVLVSADVCNLQSLDAVFIRSDIASNGSGSLLGEGSILQEVYSNSPDFSSMIFAVGSHGGINACRKQLRNNHINSAAFVITDEHGIELDLNGQTVIISLLVWKST